MAKMLARYTIVGLLIFLCACGYRFSGGGGLPGSASRVYVAMFDNRSAETGAEAVFTNALVSELLRRSGAEVVEKNRARAFISGDIRSITIGALTRTGDDEVLERRVTAVVDLKMVDGQGETLFDVTGFSGDEEFAVSGSNLSDRAFSRGAVEKVARRIAEDLVSRMTDDF
ncbi:MAG: LPS assembly lipoprotein LptE [Desulfobacteraceae bacterium]